jgi:uncharacterized protein
MTRDVAAGVAGCRQACEYFSVCGGGAPVNKLAENGSFRTTRTSFCSLTQMVPVDLILDAFEQLKGRMEHEAASVTLQTPRTDTQSPTSGAGVDNRTSPSVSAL